MQNLHHPAMAVRAAKNLPAALRRRHILIAQVQEGAHNVIVSVFCLTDCLASRRKSDSVNRGTGTSVC